MYIFKIAIGPKAGTPEFSKCFLFATDFNYARGMTGIAGLLSLENAV